MVVKMLATLLLTTLWSQVDANFVNLVFEQGSYRCGSGKLAGESVSYRLFVPRDLEPGKQYPIILWFHGLGEGGDNNLRQVRYLQDVIFTQTEDLQPYRFFLLAPQCPPEHLRWHESSRTSGLPGEACDDMVDISMRIIEELVKKHPIDRDRISVAGICSGGSGCWEFAARYGDRISCLAPLAAAGSRVPAELPGNYLYSTWAFYSQGDDHYGLASVRSAVAELQHEGRIARLTEFAAADHDCWTPAFRDCGLLEWLLAQSRGSQGWLQGAAFIETKTRLRNGLTRWSLKEAAMQAGYLTAFVLLAVRWRRLQRATNLRTKA